MTGTLHASIKAVSEDEAREPTALAPRLDRSLAAVLRRAVSRAPEARYASASDLADDLERWLRREPVTARRPGVWQRGARWVGRHPVVTTGMVCAAILLSSVVLTVASVWWLNGRPARVEWKGKGEVVRLLSFAGRELACWPRKPGELGNTFGALARRPGESDIVLLSPYSTATSGYAGLICAFDVDGPHNDPLWVAGETNVDLRLPSGGISGNPPDTYDNATPGRFFTAWGIVDDVFPDSISPGDELIAAHQFVPWSASCIRVYNTSGTVLYQIWHDGHIKHAAFDRASKILYCAAVNSESENRSMMPCSNHPLVLFALPIVPGRTDSLINSASCPDYLKPLWYRFVSPLDSACDLKIQDFELNRMHKNPHFARIRIGFVRIEDATDSGIGFSLIASGSGDILTQQIDPYNLNRIPVDINVLRLSDAPQR